MFALYLKELIEWNKKFNLTAITDPEEIKVKHFEDSLTILQSIPLSNQSVIDIGAGAGFPGIPLKIKCPGIKLTLVEATKKKFEFLKHLISILKLDNTEAIWGRAEELNQDFRYYGKYDLAVARAVAKLNKLVEYALPFLKTNGLFIAQKGPNIDEEIKLAGKALKKFGGKIQEVKRLQLSNGDKRTLVVISKL
ncbi:MAG: 16S rRNA (guanine(527)-N(7))-methyltransferase RsmG [Candidatus Margulisbacteria bacterium]|nr:16S rRNA (guanine(527)-N(7))-methyltransferase RsmG [Candidatus Margulisiibacteriota bacterium]